MEEKEPKTAAIKRRLQRYQEDHRDFINQNERYVRLVSSMESAKVQQFDAMPGAGSPTTDKMADKIVLKLELEEDIKDDKEYLEKERKALEKLIKKMPKADDRAVIRMKYFDDMDWVDISKALYRKRKDYTRATHTYLNKTYKLHGSALLSLSDVSTGSRQLEPRKDKSRE